MRYLLLLSLLIFSSLSFAQNRLHVALNAYGGYGGEREMNQGTHIGRPPSLGIHDYLTKTRWQPVVGFGAEVLYLLGQRGALTLGLDYLQAKALHEAEYTTTNQGGQIFRYEYSRSTVQQGMLRIPLGYQFTFGSVDHRIRPFLKAGVTGSYLLALKLFQSSTGATLGQETQENLIANEIQLSEDRLDYSRWQFPVSFAIGIERDRVSLSIERNWFIGDQIASPNQSDFSCGLGVFGCFSSPPHQFASTRQLQTTIIKNTYMLY